MKIIWKISSKIMLTVMICTSVLAALIGIVVLNQSSRAIEENTYMNLELTAEKYGSVFSESTEAIEATVEAYQSTFMATFDFERYQKEKEAYIQEYQNDILIPITREYASNGHINLREIYLDLNPDLFPDMKPDERIYGAWYLNASGKTQQQLMEQKKDFYPENENMIWYYDVIHAGKGLWSEPYTDMYTGDKIISYGVPIIIDDTLLGVAGASIEFGSVRSIIEKFTVFETGHAFLLSGDYNVIAGSIIETGLYAVPLVSLNDEYSQLIHAVEDHDEKLVFLGEGSSQRVLSWGEMTNGYVVVIEVKTHEIFKSLNRVRAIVDGMILLGIIMSAFVAYFLGSYIARPLTLLQRKSNRLSYLDLRESEDTHYKKNNDFNTIESELEIFRNEVQSTIFSLRNNFGNEEITITKIQSVLNRLEIILERVFIAIENKSIDEKMIEFNQDEYKKLITEINCWVDKTAKINIENKNIIGSYKAD